MELVEIKDRYQLKKLEALGKIDFAVIKENKFGEFDDMYIFKTKKEMINELERHGYNRSYSYTPAYFKTEEGVTNPIPSGYKYIYNGFDLTVSVEEKKAIDEYMEEHRSYFYDFAFDDYHNYFYTKGFNALKKFIKNS